MIQEKKLLMQKCQRDGAAKSQSYNLNDKPAAAVPTLISQNGISDLLSKSSMTAPKVNNYERFANQLILKFNILNFKKKNALENVKKLNDIGPRYFNYIEHVESQVDMIQQYLPSMLSGSYAEGT